MRIPCRCRHLPTLLAVTLAMGCARRRATSRTPSDVTPRRTLPADSVFILEATGDPPSDTVVRLGNGARHAVVLRHAASDRAAFAVVEFGDSAFGAGDSVDVTFHARPGVYGLDIASSRPIREGTITFKYARHFQAPAAARERYGSDARFEHELAVGRLDDAGTIILLPTRRPTSDNVSAALDGPGSYVVASPK